MTLYLCVQQQLYFRDRPRCCSLALALTRHNSIYMVHDAREKVEGITHVKVSTLTCCAQVEDLGLREQQIPRRATRPAALLAVQALKALWHAVAGAPDM